jgi:hypothetical protein
MVATLGRAKINQLLPALSGGARARLAAGLGSGEVPHGISPQIIHAGRDAFVYALQYGLRLGSAVALLGAVLALVLIRAREDASAPAVPEGEILAKRRSAEADAHAPRAATETIHA